MGEKEPSFPSFASPPPCAPLYSSHSLSVSFPSRKFPSHKFLKAPPTQAKYYGQPKEGNDFMPPKIAQPPPKKMVYISLAPCLQSSFQTRRKRNVSFRITDH